jgi:hypothetical protein
MNEGGHVNRTVIGMFAGIALGFAGAFGGIAAFVIVLVLGAIGFGVGRYLDGQLDLSMFSRDRIGRRP